MSRINIEPKSIRLLWHQVFIINSWWANTNHNIPKNCLSNECATLESVTHKFWFCSRATKAWEFAFSFLF